MQKCARQINVSLYTPIKYHSTPIVQELMNNEVKIMQMYYWCIILIHMLHLNEPKFNAATQWFTFPRCTISTCSVSSDTLPAGLQPCQKMNIHMLASDLPRKLNKSAFHQVGSCPAMAGTGHTSGFQMSCMLNNACRLLLQLLFSFFSLGAWRPAHPELFQSSVCVLLWHKT